MTGTMTGTMTGRTTGRTTGRADLGSERSRARGRAVVAAAASLAVATAAPPVAAGGGGAFCLDGARPTDAPAALALVLRDLDGGGPERPAETGACHAACMPDRRKAGARDAADPG